MYNTIHECYFWNRYAADIPICRTMDQVTVGNIDIVVQFYGLSLQHPSDNESQYDDSLKSTNSISSGSWFHQRNAKQFHTVHQALVSTTDIVPTARNELDARSDTVWWGKNFHTVVLNGQTFEVKGFHNSLDAIQNILVGTNEMAWTDPQDGDTYILIYNKYLTFVNDMNHLLINPNQSRSFDISVWYNPYDYEHPICIDTGDLFIPFHNEGSTVFFDTR